MYKKYSEEKSLLLKQDEDLVYLIRNGDQDALAQLYLRYRGLMYKVSFQFMTDKNLAQMHFVDLYDISLDSLYIACNEYDPNIGKSFINFWWSIVERRHMTYLQDLMEKRLEEQTEEVENKSGTQMISEAIDIIKNNENFSSNEKIFLTYRIFGFKPLEIAEIHNWSKAKLYRIKAKATAKLNKIFKSN